MPFSNHVRPAAKKAIADAQLKPYWLDNPSYTPEPLPPLTGNLDADLCVIGAGFTGLWTALLAKETNPAIRVIVLEAETAGIGASGRNGGFASASLTHGFSNGFSRWRKEIRQLVRFGHQNLAEMEETIRKYNIDCDHIRSGEITFATEPYQVENLEKDIALGASYGEHYTYLTADKVRAQVNSPIFLAGKFDAECIMLDPARLVWGLRRACLQLGVEIFENTPATGLEDRRNVVRVTTPHGNVIAQRVALATNAFPPLLGVLKRKIVPVYDYALMSEPLTLAQRASIGWQGRQGIGGAGNQFHYSQITSDGRILWGGFDAVHYPNDEFGHHLEARQETFERLAEHFFQVFPQLEGIRFTHAWGGAIDTCSRFSVFWGTAHGGKTAYAAGYTGLGVGASRFGAQVMLDLLQGSRTERTALAMVRHQPASFPPEPFRSPIIAFTQRSLIRADESGGKRDLWLKFLDALGLGFDS